MVNLLKFHVLVMILVHRISDHGLFCLGIGFALDFKYDYVEVGLCKFGIEDVATQ